MSSNIDNFKCTGILMRFGVAADKKVDVTISSLIMLNSMSNERIVEKLNQYATENDSLTSLLKYNNTTHQGVTYTWNDDHSCVIDGTTSTFASRCDLIYSQSSIPEQFEKNRAYYFAYDWTGSTEISLEALFFTPHGTISEYVNSSRPVYFPEEAVGFGLRFRVYAGCTVHGTAKNIKILKGNYQKRIPKMICFVDDDTTNTELVDKYYKNCIYNDIEGNFAVLTYHIEDGDTDVNKLLDYEARGFGTLIHANYQSGVGMWAVAPNRDVDSALADMTNGLRKMREYGFVNYNYWVTPGGNRDKDIEYIARHLGVKCLISTNNNDYNHADDATRYYIKRVALSPDDSELLTSMESVKKHIDRLLDDDKGGMLIITTHFNEWRNLLWDDCSGYERFNEIVSYAKNSSAKIMSIPEAFSYYETFCVD